MDLKDIEGDERDVWRCVNTIMEIPSKNLYCPEMKRVQFMSHNPHTWHTWLVTDAQKKIMTFVIENTVQYC